MTDHTTALVWFRRDLRLADNPALRYATAHARHVIPIYIFAPDEAGNWAPGAASRWWLHHSLHALAESLHDRQSRLIVRRGPTLATLQQLIGQTQATLLVWNRLHEPAIHLRDRAIESTLATDVEIATSNAKFLFEPGSIRNGQDLPYKVFTAFWRNASGHIDRSRPQPVPRRLARPSRWPTSIGIDELELLPRIRWDEGFHAHWSPGEAGAHRHLRTFTRVANSYDVGRNRPDMAGTSRLSPHLHFGEIGPRQLLAQLRPDTDSSADIATYVRELGWREFAQHLLHAFPDTADRPLDRRFERMQWSRRSTTLEDWQRGMTGYPIVDAGMRELWQTGWMHNRIRMIVASLLTKNLQHHWLEGARWFWDTLVDADLANNTLGWQWTAGCGADASPYYRILNPVLQAQRFDPQRAYIRKWLPELSQLPDRWIHRPWEAPLESLAMANVRLGSTYPAPLVEFKSSRSDALAAYQRLR